MFHLCGKHSTFFTKLNCMDDNKKQLKDLQMKCLSNKFNESGYLIVQTQLFV